MKPFIFPLVRRQFRGLKWFAIAFALLACWFAMGFNSTLDSAVSGFWRDGATRYYDSASPIRALRAEQSTMLVMLGMLAVAMAAFQMFDAYRPQNALLMGSLPPTRGTELAAQLGLGIAVIAMSSLLFGLLAHLSYAAHQDMMILQARMSALPGQLLADNTHWAVLVGWLRLMIALISLYLGITMFYGLFGNAALSMGVLAAMALFAYMALGIGREAMYTIHRVFPNLEGFSGRRALDAAVAIGASRLNSVAPGEPIPLMPWTDLPWFLLIHALLWTAGLFCISRTRKHLSIESLGNMFLFKVSRWALVLIVTAFPLLLPLTVVGVYNSKLGAWALNPHLYLYFIPALLVFAAGWVFVIWRPQRKLKRHALPAVALALALLLIPGLARAEKVKVPRLEAQFDSSRLSFDKAAMDRNLALSDTINAQNEEARKLRDPDYQEYNYGYSSYSEYQREVYGKYQAKPSFDNYQRLFSYSSRIIGSDGLGGYYMNEEEFSGLLRGAGLDRLADTLIGNTAESLLAAQDGYFLEWTRQILKEPEKNPGAATSNYTLWSDTPFQVIGSEAVDTAIRQGDKARRTSAFSNGDLDTQSYEIPYAERSDYGYRSLIVHVVFQNGSLDRLMLTGYKDTAAMQDGFEALRRALAAAGQSPSDADSTIDTLKQLYADDKLSSGNSGSIHWSLSKPSRNSNWRNVMIELG